MTTPKKRAAPPPTPLREVVAANLRAIIAREQIRINDLAEKLGKPRQWVYRRTVAAGPITTDDIDMLAAALEVSTDELVRRGA